MMKVAILGYGTVGSGVGEIIMNAATADVKELSVSHILERSENLHRHPLMCDDIQTILQDESVDVVVETLGGIEPAHTFIIAALKAGKHVVSANKAVIAVYLKEFHEYAQAHGVKFLYEASCGGGIPWIHGLADAKRIDDIDEIHGIFNGTSNYILDHMGKEHQPFDVILHQAQELGYAEKDPGADIDGIDIQNKLKISSAIAFDCDVPQDIPTFGIRNIRREDIEYADSLHQKIKLIADARRKEDHFYGIVEPQLLDEGSIEASINENLNLTCLHGTTIGPLMFYGQGAGKLPTANAIVQDIIDIQKQCPTAAFTPKAEMHYDSALIEHAYVIRSNLEEAAMKEILGDDLKQCCAFRGMIYYQTKKISAYWMHDKMKEILTQDKDAFMMGIREVNA